MAVEDLLAACVEDAQSACLDEHPCEEGEIAVVGWRRDLVCNHANSLLSPELAAQLIHEILPLSLRTIDDSRPQYQHRRVHLEQSRFHVDLALPVRIDCPNRVPLRVRAISTIPDVFRAVRDGLGPDLLCGNGDSNGTRDIHRVQPFRLLLRAVYPSKRGTDDDHGRGCFSQEDLRGPRIGCSGLEVEGQRALVGEGVLPMRANDRVSRCSILRDQRKTNLARGAYDEHSPRVAWRAAVRIAPRACALRVSRHCSRNKPRHEHRIIVPCARHATAFSANRPLCGRGARSHCGKDGCQSTPCA
mmetsp:Transcript_89804/g.253269  ORF Transcript_89804/g.253269 Transcript_89804/m.253269 type:complete len:302 (+) Transcript_89804:385-1290(+)